MAYIGRNTQTGFVVAGPLDVFRSLQKRWAKMIKRREVATLLEQDEWLLKDIGITRGDVIEALHKPGDASVNLKVVAARRRFWSRQRERI